MARAIAVSNGVLIAGFFLWTPAFAQATTSDADLIVSIGALLGKLLLVLLLLESAMAALFNWRVYRVVLSGRAWKTPIMFGIGLLVVTGFDYDFIDTAITDIAGGGASDSLGWVSVTLSAMVIAGGSQGVHDILKKLGLRSSIPDAEAKPDLREDQVSISPCRTAIKVNSAWLAAPSFCFTLYKCVPTVRGDIVSNSAI
jgi:hypothetical protein